MILGIGTDIVDVARFDSWKERDEKQLLNLFTRAELAYYNDYHGPKSEFLASRFAAKEAFFKALSAALVKLGLNSKAFTFMFLCKNVEVAKKVWNVPTLNVNWKEFEKKIGHRLDYLQTELSISHEKKYSISFVVIYKK